MCNLSQGVFDRAFNDGFNDGVNRTTIDSVISLREKTGKSIEECLYMIGVQEDKYDLYTEMIEEKLGLQPV